ncbi:hypothetical protein [Occallatibacter riparius]|uniref:Uncharacterized protein n=1 Tax=Occallatibacter riparius TaxID=1002689 RepID=A0A9J7BNU8_9BACT|nr:hypothetical protein [Occallatibacter riparius]UWZ84295.1 hypothetical protein MOP44_27580 [Occallatibacter riparius]
MSQEYRNKPQPKWLTIALSLSACYWLAFGLVLLYSHNKTTILVCTGIAGLDLILGIWLGVRSRHQQEGNQ